MTHLRHLVSKANGEKGDDSRRSFPGTMPRIARWALLLGTPLAVLLLIYTPLIFGDVVVSRDVGRLFLAVHQYVFERLRSGELPLWYPYEALGVPFIGSAVTAVFHPLTWLSVLLGPVRGMWAGQLVSVVVAVTGTVLLARRLGSDYAGAAVAGVCFGGGGALVSMLDLQTFFLGPAAFPWLLLGVHGAVTKARSEGTLWLRESGHFVALAAGALAWQVLAGDMQGAVVTGTSSVVFGLIVAAPGSRWRALGLIASIGVLGALLSAAQLFPTVEIAPEVDRSTGLAWHLVREWSLHPARLSEIFLGHQGGLSSSEILGWLYPDREEAWHTSVYMGSIVLLGTALAAPLVGKSTMLGRAVLALLVLTCVCLWLALGRWGGLYRIAYEMVPLWSSFRYPEKLFCWAALPLALLAGIGTSEALRSPRRGAIFGLTFGGLLGLAALLSWVIGDGSDWYRQYLALSAPGLLRASLLIGCLGLGFFFLARRRSRPPSLAGAVVVLFVLLDLAGPNGRLVERITANPLVLDSPSLVGMWLREERGVQGTGGDRITSAVGRGLALVLPDELTTHDGLTLEAVLWSRHALNAGHAGTLGFESTTHYLPALSRRHNDLQVKMFGGWVRYGAQIFSGRYLIVNAATLEPASFPEHHPALDLSDFGIWVLEHPDPLPRVFIASPLPVFGEEQARSGLALPEVTRGRVALVEHLEQAKGAEHIHASAAPGDSKAPIPLAEDADLGSEGSRTTGPMRSSAHIVEHRPERVRIVAETDERSVLVLNDAWWPGWRATINGEPTPVLRVNYLVRGVMLEQGTNEVIFEYPLSLGLSLGLWFSLFAAVTCLLLALLGRRPIG